MEQHFTSKAIKLQEAKKNFSSKIEKAQEEGNEEEVQ